MASSMSNNKSVFVHDNESDKYRNEQSVIANLQSRAALFLNLLPDFCSDEHTVESRRFLFIVFGGLGDTLLCESLFSHIKSILPDSEIHVLSGCHLPILHNMPSIDEIIIAPPDYLLHTETASDAFKDLTSHIADRKYDTATELLSMVPLNGINSIYTGLLLKASGARVRLGRKNCGKLALRKHGSGQTTFMDVTGLETAVNVQYTPPPPSIRQQHESLMIGTHLGFGEIRPSIHPVLSPIGGIAQAWANALIDSLSDNGRLLVAGVTMESTYTLKGWPEERFVEVMASTAKEGIRFVLVGQHMPRLADAINVDLKGRVMNLAGKTNLEELMALISGLDFFLAVDSGPAHLAQSYGIPTVVLFGPSNEKEFGPRSAIHRMLLARRTCGRPPCIMGPCHCENSCMLTIDAQQVISALLDLAKCSKPLTKKADSAQCNNKKVYFFGNFFDS